jgi:hypothetical protein
MKPILTVLKRFQFTAILTSLYLTLAPVAQAQSEASIAVSALPVASVVVVSGAGLSVAGAASTAAVAIPAALSIAGSKLVIVSAEIIASGTVYVVERLSDGARATFKVVAASTRGLAYSVGTTVVVSVLASGVILSTAGQVLAFIPSEVGRVLLHNERLTFENSRPEAR